MQWRTATRSSCAWGFFAASCLLLTSFLTLTLSSIESTNSSNHSGNSFHRIAFGSCFNPNRGDSVFSLIATLRPQQFLSLGDIIYADFHPKYNYKQYANPAIIREEYEKVFRKSEVITKFVQSLSHGWLMTYDDHDYGRNNGDKTFQYRQETMDLFHEYAPRLVGRHVVVRKEQLQRLLQYLYAHAPQPDGPSSPVDTVLNCDEATKKELIHTYFIQKKNADVAVGLEVSQLSSSALLRALHLTEHSGGAVGPSDEEGIAIRKEGVYSSEVFSVPVPNDDVEPSVLFHYKVILLDGRSSKDCTGTPFGDFLGLDQWLWLQDELNPHHPENQNIDLFLIGSAIQILPDDKLVEECWDEFPHQRQLLLSLASELSLYSNVLLLTGDIHSAEIAQASCNVIHANRQTGSISNDTVSIIEITSSGLSHTFTKVTGKQPQQKKGKQANSDSELTGAAVNQRSRGFIVEFLSSLYQISYPGHFRERKHVDAFQGLHFATLDLVALPTGNTNNKGGRVNVNIQIVNHEGNPVIEKSWPLQEKRFWTAEEETVEVAECLPFWNVVPWYKVLLFRASMVSFGMIFVLFPVLVLFWLLGAAIYYLCIGGELLRRDRIEKRYQKRHQLFVGKGNKQL